MARKAREQIVLQKPPKPPPPGGWRGWWRASYCQIRQRPALSGLILLGWVVALAAGAYYLGYRPWVHASHRREADQALREVDFPTALEHLRACVALAPDQPEAHFLLGRTYRRFQDYELARRHLAEAQRLGYDPGTIHLEHLMMQMQQGTLPESDERLLARCVQDSHPDQFLILEALADGCVHSYRMHQAERWLSIWLQRDPQSWLPWLLRADLHSGSQREDYSQVRADYERVLELKPDHPRAHLRLGELFLSQGWDPRQALRHLSAYARQRADDPAGLVGLARAQRALGQAEDALRALEAVVAKHPQDGAACLTLGLLLAEDFQHDQAALPWLQRAARLMPGHSQAQARLAVVCRRLHRDGEATAAERRVQELEKAGKELARLLEQVPRDHRNVELLCHVAAQLAELDRREEAMSWLRRALLIDPQNQATVQALAKHQQQRRVTADRVGDP